MSKLFHVLFLTNGKQELPACEFLHTLLSLFLFSPPQPFPAAFFMPVFWFAGRKIAMTEAFRAVLYFMCGATPYGISGQMDCR